MVTKHFLVSLSLVSLFPTAAWQALRLEGWSFVLLGVGWGQRPVLCETIRTPPPLPFFLPIPQKLFMLLTLSSPTAPNPRLRQ